MQEEGHCDEEIYKAMSSVCLSYDNMCHMDGLKIAREDLPLPKPFNKAWELVGKVIGQAAPRKSCGQEVQNSV